MSRDESARNTMCQTPTHATMHTVARKAMPNMKTRRVRGGHTDVAKVSNTKG